MKNTNTVTKIQLTSSSNLKSKLIALALATTMASLSTAQSPGTYGPAIGPAFNPMLHSGLWATYPFPGTPPGALDFQGRIRAIPSFIDSPNTTGYVASVYGSGEDAGEEQVIFGNLMSFKPFIEYFPVGNESPAPVDVKFITAKSGEAYITSRYDPGDISGHVNFNNSLVLYGGFDSRAYTHPEYVNPGHRYIATEAPTMGVGFDLINGRWVSVNYWLGLLEHTINAEAIVTEGDWSVGGTFYRAYKMTWINGIQLNRGWIPEDVNADNEVGPADYDAIVSAFGTSATSVPPDPLWNKFADIDQDGEIGPGDFDGIVAKYGIDITFDLTPGFETDNTTQYLWYPPVVTP